MKGVTLIVDREDMSLETLAALNAGAQACATKLYGAVAKVKAQPEGICNAGVYSKYLGMPLRRFIVRTLEKKVVSETELMDLIFKSGVPLACKKSVKNNLFMLLKRRPELKKRFKR